MSTQRPCRQTLQYSEETGEDLQTHQRVAIEKYSSDSPSHALEKYARNFRVPGLFFRDDEGVRCTWGQDIEDTSRRYDKRKQVRVGDRHYLIRLQPKTLKQIDRPRSTLYHNLVAHPSEHRWARPDGHPYHFNKFPQEIKDSIFSFVLSIPDKVRPCTVQSNWKTNYCQPHYDVHDQYRFSKMSYYSSIVWMKRRDRDGTFFVMRKVERPGIDATLLRTCKEFYKDGISILYGKNVFEFQMNEYSNQGSPFTLIGGCIQFHPAPEKPHLQSPDWDAEVQEGICQIHLGRPVEMLSGWIYFDPFLRFLHTIGVHKTAMIKLLNFTGLVKLHSCNWSECTRCEQDIVMGIRLYIPFIIRFCTALESITINCVGDIAVRDPGDPSPATYEEALRPLIEDELCQIHTLVNLEVVTTQLVSTDENGQRHYEDRRADFAIPSINWFKTRGNRAADQKGCEGVDGVKDQSDQVICEFCGESHVWAECHNLCGYCGRYGHFRDSCLALYAIYEEQGVRFPNDN